MAKELRSLTTDYQVLFQTLLWGNMRLVFWLTFSCFSIKKEIGNWRKKKTQHPEIQLGSVTSAVRGSASAPCLPRLPVKSILKNQSHQASEWSSQHPHLGAPTGLPRNRRFHLISHRDHWERGMWPIRKEPPPKDFCWECKEHILWVLALALYPPGSGCKTKLTVGDGPRGRAEAPRTRWSSELNRTGPVLVRLLGIRENFFPFKPIYAKFLVTCEWKKDMARIWGMASTGNCR